LGYLLALRQSDGTQLWRSAILTNPSVPVAGEGVVVVTSTSTTQPTSSPTLNLLAFDTLTGRQRWQYQTTSVASQPLLMNGIVYLSSAVDTHGMLTALTAASGTVKWQIPLSGLASTLMQVNGIIYASLINPCVGESCPSAASNVVAIRAADGRVLWELPPTGLVAPPLFAGSRLILFDSTGVLAGFDAMTGHQIWHTLIAGAGACNTACNLVVAGGIVILSATAQDGLSAIPPSLIAVRADTGDQIWQVTSQSTISTVLTDGNALIYGSHDDNANITHLITSSDGSQRWQSPANVQSQPLAATHGVIYTAEAPRSGQDSWAMVARAGANGHSLWHTALADQPTQAIANGGLLLVSAQPMISGTASQVIAGMNATNGTLLWQVAIPTGFTVFILAK
jgi:outer membrane protein assembly factor BamB